MGRKKRSRSKDAPDFNSGVIVSSRSPKRSSSKESMASNVYGALERSAASEEGFQGTITSSSPIYSAAAVIIECKKHSTIAFEKVSSEKNGLFFPLMEVYKQSPIDVANTKLKNFLSKSGGSGRSSFVGFSTPILIHTLMIQVPGLRNFIQRWTFFTELNDPDGLCCQNVKSGIWIPKSNLVSRLNEFWGTECVTVIQQMEPTTATHIQSLEVTEPYKLYSDKPVNDGSSALHHLVKGIDLTRDQFNKYYWDFVKFCYPSSGMSFLAFTDYLTKTGFYGPSVSSNSKKDETIRFFRSFTFLGQPSLSFKEFIMGIIVTDTRLPTTPKLEEIRAQYILAYYAIDAKQGLAKQDLMKLMFDARTTSGSDGLFNQFHVNGFINPANMVNVIGSKEVRGGSSLLRSSYDVKNRPKFVLTSLDESAFTSSDAVVGRSTRTTAVKCSSCQVKRYSIAGHAITIDSKGKLMENKSIDKILPFQAKMRSKAMRTLSNSIFLDAYVPNTTISLIQEFAVIKGILAKASTVKNPRDYLQTTQPASWILKLCDLVEDTFRKQSRLLKISSPTVVFGDIHGNLHDLLIFEHLYWPSGAALHPCNLLFLGDYVDRGLYDLEVILYLFSSMLLAQNHLFMLRGNHETKAVNSQFDFMKHCKERLGSIGQTIYERINRVFDHMPVACVIDDKIFCCHGGVPFGSNATTASLDEINSIPCPLEATEQRDPLAWQILWNDPQENMEFQQTIRENKSSNFMDNAMLIKSGFAPNTKRATGFYFNETAVDNFLTKNGLSHVIRGHECPPEGYRFHHQGKTTTVFSSSGYSLDNQAAVLIVDDNKIRPVMIDTKDK